MATSTTSRPGWCPAASLGDSPRRVITDPACAEDRYCRYRGWRCRDVGYRIPRGYEVDSRCTRSGGRVVRFQYGDGG
jgi:hypothetical protein